MKRNIVWSLPILSMFIVACGSHSGVPGAPSTVVPNTAVAAPISRTLLTPSPIWTGTTTASDGPTGTVVLTFGASNTVVWTGPTGTFNGTVAGQLPDLTITGVNAAQGCVYHAFGTVSNGVFAGGYDLSGGNCVDKSGHGTFRVTQGAATLSCGPYSYEGPTKFELENSSDATELAFVHAHVVNGTELSGPSKLDLSHKTTWTSDGAYPVVLVKGAEHEYRIYLNVQLGDVLTSPSTNKHGDLQDISHISKFACTIAQS